MRALPSVVLFLAALAGCADSDSAPLQEVPETEEPAPSSVVVDLEQPAWNSTGMQTLKLHAIGQPSDWLFMHVPFRTPSDSIGFSYDYNVDVAADADGQGAFFWPLGTTYATQDGFAVTGGNPFQQQYLTFDANQQEWIQSGGMGAGSYMPFAGLLFALAADSGWTIDLRLDTEIALANATIVTGSGATFQHGAELLAPVPGGGPVNQMTFSADVPAEGWSHMEFIHQRIEPLAVTDVTIRLPNGYMESRVGTTNGYYVPMYGGSASSGDRVDYVGSFKDIPGTATAQMTYVEVAAGVDVGYVHIPFNATQVPALQGTEYFGMTWPFMDELPLPDPPGTLRTPTATWWRT